MAKALQNFGSVWQRTTLVQRVLLLSILLGCVGSAAMLVAWARKPNMALLYSGLSPQDASKIMEKVRDSGTTYELKDGGTTVLVPTEKVYSLRLSLAGESLPSGDQAGYRILDEEKIGTSPFTQRINYTRAIEGELAKTVGMVDGVASARVHVVRPEGTLFAGKEKEASATVLLKLKGGRQLTSTNVAAIIHLVAGSVEGLSTEKVVVVDGQGNLLSGAGGNDLAKGAGTFLDYKSNVELYLSKKAEDMLATVLGPNRATVKVSAVILTSSLTQTTETYDPEKKVVTKEETKSKSSPSAAPSSQPAAPGKEETISNEYMVSKITEQKSDVPGEVKSLTVAAFVDLRDPSAKEGEAAKEVMPIKDVEEIIRNAIGLKVTDTLKVVNVPFRENAAVPAEAATAAPAGMFSKDFLLDIAQRSSLGFLVIGALVALKIFRGSKKKSGDAAPGAALDVAGASAGSSMLAASGDIDPNQLRARITRALQDNPDEVKRLFLNWVESEKEPV